MPYSCRSGRLLSRPRAHAACSLPLVRSRMGAKYAGCRVAQPTPLHQESLLCETAVASCSQDALLGPSRATVVGEGTLHAPHEVAMVPIGVETAAMRRVAFEKGEALTIRSLGASCTAHFRSGGAPGVQELPVEALALLRSCEARTARPQILPDP